MTRSPYEHYVFDFLGLEVFFCVEVFCVFITTQPLDFTLGAVSAFVWINVPAKDFV